MRGQRVLVTGMGGELGSLVAALLEDAPWVGAIRGVDLEPPRRRLRRSEFSLIDPTSRTAIDHIVTTFNPHVIVHVGVYEPDARASTNEALAWTKASAETTFAAAHHAPALRAIVVRSGIEVYGRGPDAPDQPSETDLTAPTTPFGHALLNIERLAREVAAGMARQPNVACVRLAPVVGGHVPSPLGRLLRAPFVPRSLLHNPSFCLVGTRDAATALVAAAANRLNGTVNVAGSGTTTVRDSIRAGHRFPLRLIDPQWQFAKPVFRLQGMPIPEHVIELLTRGRLADTSRMMELLGCTPAWSTAQVVEALHDWQTVTRTYPGQPRAGVTATATPAAVLASARRRG